MKGKEGWSVQKEVRDTNEEKSKSEFCEGYVWTLSQKLPIENSYWNKALDTLDSMLGRKEENGQQARI